MKTRIIFLVVIGAMVLPFGTRSTSVRSQQQQLAGQERQVAELKKAADRWTVGWYARLAKAKGQQAISMPAPDIDYGEARDLDEALDHFSAVIAEPVEQRTYADNQERREDSREIVTWYTFSTVDALSRVNSTCADCPAIDPPKELLPLQPNEFLVSKVGGTLLVDGVRVSMVDPAFPQFEIGKRYLLLAGMPGSRVARISPTRVFSISEEGLLEPVNNEPHPIKTEIGERFGSSIRRFKDHLQFNR